MRHCVVPQACKFVLYVLSGLDAAREGRVGRGPPRPVKSPPLYTGSTSSQEQVYLWALGSPVVLFPVSPESARGSGPSALSGPIGQGTFHPRLGGIHA